ncbi:polyisoprenoid-binding protein [Pontibacter diazotrophicus]|uniref:Polyisoprenoid-binding protein n=1 Tax=Pontibacter diazotrophicus TaxID=1400979 RepID=A0A3D8LBU7_9BACT|nr:YceI family protein [Pontibacter diazotrophicus]RDV14911.1 polyisoprenoid-binding protein [Pontibacter diazotrophicus]
MANVKWAVDPTHSEVQFKVKHLMITTVTGYFQNFSVEAETENEQFSNPTNVVFTADIDSISTNNEQRDTHLKSADFFDAAQHNELRFVGTKYENVGGDDYKLHGDLTIRGNTKPATFNVEFGGIVVDPYGQTKAGFTVSGKISRKEFGLTWDAVTEAGSVVVSDDVKLQAEIQLVKQA